EEKPGPKFFVDQHRALAMPANPGCGRMVAFQNRTGVDVTFLLATELAQKIVDLVQLRRDYVVIIITPRVARDSPPESGPYPGRSLFSGARVRRLHRTLKII